MRHGPARTSASGREPSVERAAEFLRRSVQPSGRAKSDYQQTGTPVGVVAGMPAGSVALP